MDFVPIFDIFGDKKRPAEPEVVQQPVTLPGDVLPPLPGWPASGYLLFSTTQWNALTKALTILHADHNAILGTVGPIIASEGTLMTAIDDLAAATADLETQDHALVGSVTTLTAAIVADDASVTSLLAAYDSVKNGLSAADQATLAAATASVNQTKADLINAATNLATQTAALAAQQSSVDTDVQPAQPVAPPVAP